MNSIEEIVNRKILEKGISLKDFCEKIGISTVAIHKLFRNNSTSLKTLNKMADVLDISVSDFFENKREQSVSEPEGIYLPMSKYVKLLEQANGNLEIQLASLKNVSSVAYSR